MSGDERKPAAGFVSLKTVKQGPPDTAAALSEIRQIYFRTSRQTIENDFAHAIELLKALPDDESRMKAHVFMEGLAEMRKQWSGGRKAAKATKSGAPGRRRGRTVEGRKAGPGDD